MRARTTPPNAARREPTRREIALVAGALSACGGGSLDSRDRIP
ncbi:hypothetical protein [Amycolatopsis iheyensis]|nr:hypothetical protein [Amycolatopsis iheyensis]